jgi:hypothetical protein
MDEIERNNMVGGENYSVCFLTNLHTFARRKPNGLFNPSSANVP